jgi:hypothetical protein
MLPTCQKIESVEYLKFDVVVVVPLVELKSMLELLWLNEVHEVVLVLLERIKMMI